MSSLFYAKEISPKFETKLARKIFAHQRSSSVQIDTQNYFLACLRSFGGNSQLWGAYCLAFNKSELSRSGIAEKDINPHYSALAKSMKISGENDALGCYHGNFYQLGSPPPISPHLETHLNRLRNFPASKNLVVGRARLAVMTEGQGGREACTGCGLCLHGCQHHSIYRPTLELSKLRGMPNVTIIAGETVVGIERSNDKTWFVKLKSGTQIPESSHVIITAGTVNSTRLVANLVGRNSICVPILNNPVASMAFIMPQFIGKGFQEKEFALAQTAFRVGIKGTKDFALGTNFSMSTIPLHIFANRVPAPFHYSMKLMRYLSSGIFLTTIYLPGRYSNNSLSITNAGEKVEVEGRTSIETIDAFNEIKRSIARTFAASGAYLIPSTFTMTTPGADAHYAGTIPIGGDGLFNCTPDCEIKGFEGIYVADASVISHLPEKHLTFTVMANAQRIAKRVARLA